MDLQSPRPPTTVRRNPPRRAKQTPSTKPPTPSSSAAIKSVTPFPIDELLRPDPSPVPPPPPPCPKPPAEPNLDASEALKVFLRIRPLEVHPRPGKNPSSSSSGVRPRPRKKDAAASPKSKSQNVCLVVNDSHSVTLSARPSLLDPKRAKSEVYDGFSFVFRQESRQQEVYERVMSPLVVDFLEGKSALLVAMGPTGSGKTHTMFGCPREPGMVPLALQEIFSHATGNGDPSSSRSYYLSMFEIYSERGKGERIIDLSSDGIELSLQQSTIKGLQEVMISSAAEAESLVAHGMLRRATAATNSNDQSSRSQCIINIRSAKHSVDDDNDVPANTAVLTIADLAGAERERKTGNQGTRFLESNFINNTSMVFGLCLRSLLEHQKNRRKPLEKHFKNSLLTRYLRNYLEGRKRMTLILTVKPGEGDYTDTSFLLRQASPYMKIKFNSLEEPPNLHYQKRHTTSLFGIEHRKRRKFNESGTALVDEGKSDQNENDAHQTSEKDADFEKLQWIEPPQISNSSLVPLKGDHSRRQFREEFYVEFQRLKRNEEVMRNFARAFWKFLKQYKQKLEESESEVCRLKQSLKKESMQVMELNKELEELRSGCLCCKHPSAEEYFDFRVDAPFDYCADEDVDDNLTSEPICQIPESPTATGNDPGVDISVVKRPFLNENSTGDDKSSLPSSMEQNLQGSLLIEKNKVQCSATVDMSDIQIPERLPGTLLVQEDLEGLTGLGVEMVSSKLSQAENANGFSSFSEVNDIATCSLVEKYTELPDDKPETSNIQELITSTAGFRRQINQTTGQEFKNFMGKDDHCEDIGDLKNFTLRELSSAERSSGSASKDLSLESCAIMLGVDSALSPSKEQRSTLEEKQPESNKSLVRDVRPSDECQANALKQEKHESPSKPFSAEKQKRRLLPASAILLRDLTGLDMEADKTKESRSKLIAKGRVRTQGSISLLRLLASNCHQ